MNIFATKTRRWILGSSIVGLLLPSIAAGQQVEYYHLDALGSVRAITDENGGIVTRHDYLPYGEEWNEPPSNDARRFTGKERDTETALDYFGARYYSAAVSSLTSVDPAMTTGANIADPQRWNRYAYARSNPSKFVDPTGRTIELTGDRKEKSLTLLRQLAGVGEDDLFSSEVDGHTIVRSSDEFASSGRMAGLIALLINHERTVELNFDRLGVERLRTTNGYSTLTLGEYGGGGTLGSEESPNGNTQIFIQWDGAGAHATAIFLIPRLPYPSDDGNPLSYTDAGVLAHELGHAFANLNGMPIKGSQATAFTSLFFENTWRYVNGYPNRRTRH